MSDAVNYASSFNLQFVGAVNLQRSRKAFQQYGWIPEASPDLNRRKSVAASLPLSDSFAGPGPYSKTEGLVFRPGVVTALVDDLRRVRDRFVPTAAGQGQLCLSLRQTQAPLPCMPVARLQNGGMRFA
jgi:hypothetical protein